MKFIIGFIEELIEKAGKIRTFILLTIILMTFISTILFSIRFILVGLDMVFWTIVFVSYCVMLVYTIYLKRYIVKKRKHQEEKQLSILEEPYVFTVDDILKKYQEEEKMLKLEDLVIHATSDVYFSIHNSEGELLMEGNRDDLENDYDLDIQVDDYWIEDETLHVHVLDEGEI